MDTEERDALAARAIKGDETALLRRIEADKGKLYSIAYSYMRNETDALEAVQETVCRVWVKRRTLREPKYFTTWMIRILIRVCMDERKKLKRERARSWNKPSDAIVDGQLNHSDSKMDMAELIRSLPNPYRMVIVLKYYRDMTITDIAELLEKPDGTVRTWLNKALRLLRVDISQMEGGSENELGARSKAGQSGFAER